MRDAFNGGSEIIPEYKVLVPDFRGLVTGSYCVLPRMFATEVLPRITRIYTNECQECFCRELHELIQTKGRDGASENQPFYTRALCYRLSDDPCLFRMRLGS